jgi:hypothetical protein
MQINELDQPKLYSLQNEYLEDTFAETTSAEQLQRDAYVLGYKRCHSDAVALLAVILRMHYSALPKGTRAQIERVIA